MRTNPLLRKSLALAIIFAVLPILTFAQASNAVSSQAGIVPSRITQSIDETRLTVLKGNTHPLARTEFDRGAATPGITLHRMLLSLKRSPEQESALQQLLVDLQDKSSPNYHQWLTPEQFGRQFGPSDQDMQTVTTWLEAHGFQVANVTKGRTVIEFSGTLGQVSEAFHTQMHMYSVQGQEQWANASDPQIPAALTGVVAGVSTLHNFVKKPHFKVGQLLTGTRKPGPLPALNLQGCTVNANPCPVQDQFIFHALGPGDFATIYNTPTFLNINAPAQKFNGDGVTIAIVGRSNINVSDIQEFRAIFGIAAANLNIVLNGPDPGNLGGGEEFEAVLDATWSSSVAPNATVDFVVSQTTETSDGVDLSEVFIIDNNLASAMSESFGLCEQQAGAAQANAESSVAEQAAAQGITFMASTGDAGAEGCDDPNAETVATQPIGVQIPAALPFTVAVGGTIFTQNDAAFWNAKNSAAFESAEKYIPEDVWNESCATQATCLASVTAGGGGPNILAGSGGASTIFPTPAFQTGVPGLSGTKRETPDVSLNAAVFHDPAALCLDDQGSNCTNPANFTIFTVGGTSVASPSFTGIMALVNQATGERQGEAGFVLYKLAAAEAASPGFAACNASTGTGPTSPNCVFNDVTSGNNAVPGETGFGNANASFQAGTGYDEASGLGSVNGTNLVNAWKTAQPNQSKTTLASLVAPASHGGSATYNIAVAAKTGLGVPTGDVALIANTGAKGQTGGITLSTMTLAAGVASGTTTALPAGNYSVFAHYEGDATFMPSDSASMNVNIGKENSVVKVEVNFVNPDTGMLSNNVGSVQFGSNYLIRINVTGASGSCAGNDPGSSGCPSGTITLKDGANLLDAGTFALNADGYAEDQVESLSCCTMHTLNATYAPDANSSFNGNTTSSNIGVVQAVTNSSVTASPMTTNPGFNVTFVDTITTESFGTLPTGTVSFFNGSTQLGGAVPVTSSVDPATGFAQATASTTAIISGLGPVNGPEMQTRPKFPIVPVALGMLLTVVLVWRFSSANRRRYAYVGLTFAVFMLAGMAACGGGGGGNRAHNVMVTAKYSGDTNYAPTASNVTVMVQ
jgi:hypothetical protein